MFTLISSEWYRNRKFEKLVGNLWHILRKQIFWNWKGNGVKDMLLLPARNKSSCQLSGGWGEVHQYRAVSSNEWARSVGIRKSLSCDASKVITGGNVIKTNLSLCVSLRTVHITTYKSLMKKWIDLVKSLDLPTIVQEQRSVLNTTIRIQLAKRRYWDRYRTNMLLSSMDKLQWSAKGN